MKFLKWQLIPACLVLAFFWTFGPGYPVDLSPQEIVIEGDPQAYLESRESQVRPLPQTEKLLWGLEQASPEAPLLIQLHGFSATRQEISPVAETLAQNLKWPLFMTRLTGHGLGSEGMNQVTAQALLQDAEEARAIARRLGRKMVLLACSTGVPLAISLAHRYPDEILGMVWVSPNFRPYRSESLMLTGPLGKWIATTFVRRHRWTPKTPEVARYWTTDYSALAIHEMMNLLMWIRNISLNAIQIPLLVFYTEQDDVVSVKVMKSRLSTYGGLVELVERPGAPHVLAGQWMHPEGTAPVVSISQEFLLRL